MNVGELMFRLSEAGITLACGRTEDRLNAKPTSALTPELIEEIRQYKMQIIQNMREDEGMRHIGIVQSERHVLELAREYLGPSHPFDPDEHPPSKRELWVDSDKEAFFFPYRYLGRGGTA
jgi:hypothetical protein